MQKKLITLVLVLAATIALVSFSGGPVRAEEQVVAPGDQLSVTVLGEPDLTKRVIVDSEGKITLPMAGEVEVGGVTTTEGAARLRNKLTKFLKNPQVTIEVAEAAKRMVVVTGAVKTPGVYQIDATTNLMAGLTLAGGYTADADLSKVTVTRGLKKENVLPIDLTQFLSGVSPQQNIMLQANDTIVVPEKNPVQGNIFVLGEVNQRGPYPIREGMTFREAIAAAGGVTEFADTAKVTVKHQNDVDGKLVDFLKATNGDPNANIVLAAGDTVYVPPMEINGTFTIIGPVAKPGQYPIRGNMFITDGVATAGGMSETGKMSDVKITRVVGGKSQTIKANLTKIGDGKMENIALMPGDTVLVATKGAPMDKGRMGSLGLSLLLLLGL